MAVNRPLSRELAELVAEQFVEVLHAPGYGEGAVDLLREKLKNLRLLESDERRRPTPGERDVHRVLGGMLIQDRDTESEDRDTMEVVAGTTPTEREWGDLMFAWRVVKHVRSNAIVIARDTATVGIGAGQMSRIDSTQLALGKALTPVAGAVLASDAFFPFADGVQAALDAGVRVIIEPGGSKRDAEVIAAVEKRGRHARLHGPPPLHPLRTGLTARPLNRRPACPASRRHTCSLHPTRPLTLSSVRACSDPARAHGYDPGRARVPHDPRPGRAHADRVPAPHAAGRRCARAREARVHEPGRVDQGSHRTAHDRGRRAATGCCGPAARSSRRRRATRASGSRWSRHSAATAACS